MITIWGRDNSTNVKKVLWCAEELALPYQHIVAGGQFGLNHEADYLAMNPNGLIPCLRDDDLVLWESNTIVRYLAAQYVSGFSVSCRPRQARQCRKMDGLGNLSRRLLRAGVH